MSNGSSSSSSIPDGVTLPGFGGGPMPSNLLSLGMQPYLLTGILVDHLRAHFLIAENIELADLREQTWSAGDATKLVIESSTNWLPQRTEGRPALIVKRNTNQCQYGAMGSRGQGQSTDARGNAHFAVQVIGSHTVFAICGNGAHAELLAAEAWAHLLQTAPALAPRMQLLRLQVLQAGAIARIEESGENMGVPVTIGYAYELKWELAQQVRRLGQVQLRT